MRAKPHLEAIVTRCLTDLSLGPEKREAVALAVLNAYSHGMSDTLLPFKELLLNSSE